MLADELCCLIPRHTAVEPGLCDVYPSLQTPSWHPQQTGATWWWPPAPLPWVALCHSNGFCFLRVFHNTTNTPCEVHCYTGTYTFLHYIQLLMWVHYLTCLCNYFCIDLKTIHLSIQPDSQFLITVMFCRSLFLIRTLNMCVQFHVFKVSSKVFNMKQTLFDMRELSDSCPLCLLYITPSDWSPDPFSKTDRQELKIGHDVLLCLDKNVTSTSSQH
jgi:hypothetical protein